MYPKSYRFYRFYKFYRLPYLIIFQQARSQTQLLCFQSTWSNHKKLNICIFNNNLCVMFLVQKMCFSFHVEHSFLEKKIWPFLWMGFSCLKATEPLWGNSLLFDIYLPGARGTLLIDLLMIKHWVDLVANQWC